MKAASRALSKFFVVRENAAFSFIHDKGNSLGGNVENFLEISKATILIIYLFLKIFYFDSKKMLKDKMWRDKIT